MELQSNCLIKIGKWILNRFKVKKLYYQENLLVNKIVMVKVKNFLNGFPKWILIKVVFHIFCWIFVLFWVYYFVFKKLIFVKLQCNKMYDVLENLLMSLRLLIYFQRCAIENLCKKKSIRITTTVMGKFHNEAMETFLLVFLSSITLK